MRPKVLVAWLIGCYLLLWFSAVAGADLRSATKGLPVKVLPFDHVFELCIENMFPSLESPPVRLSLLPDPPPLFLGCRLPGCGPEGSKVKTLDLHVSLTGELAQDVGLALENIAPAVLDQVQVQGTASKEASAVRVQRGTALLRGFPHDPAADLPVIVPHISLDPTAVNNAIMRAARERGSGKSPEQFVDLVVEQVSDGHVVNAYRIRYKLMLCRPPKLGRAADITDAIELKQFKGTARSVVLISAESESACLVDEIAYVEGGTDRVEIENMLSPSKCLNKCLYDPEITVFARDQAMALKKPVPELKDTPGDVVPVPLSSDPLRIPVTLWVMVLDASSAEIRREPAEPVPAEPRAKRALEDLDRANEVFNNSECGVEFDTKDERGEDRVWISHVPPGKAYLLNASCEGEVWVQSLKDEIGHTDGSLNVYYLDKIGPPGRSNPRGQQCHGGDEHIIIVDAINADHETVAHEFGHTLGLQLHANRDFDNRPLESADFDNDTLGDFTKDNIMWGGGEKRGKLTKGQCFRFNMSRASYLFWRRPALVKPLSDPTGRQCFEVTNHSMPTPACPHIKIDAN